MINKEEILNKYNNKEERLIAAYILDKIFEYMKKGISIGTYFLNLNEFKITISILNKFDLDYHIFSLDGNLERRSIVIGKKDFSHISCIKVICNKKMLHRDYMGSIYNIGIVESAIGDIIVKEDATYIFVLTKVLKFLEYNFTKVGKYNVNIENIPLEESLDLSFNFKEVNIIASSYRIDIVLAKVFLLTRSEVLKKIKKGELFINSKCINNNSYLLKENDIVSFKKCGKFKYIKVLKNTKKGKKVIQILMYD